MDELEDLPACYCCPHLSWEQVEADELLREVWEYCPDSTCLENFCEQCKLS